MKTTFKEFYLSERRGNVSKNNKIIMIHGTSNKFLKSILRKIAYIDSFDVKRYLSDSTILRRRSNIKTLLKLVDELVTKEKMHRSIWNIVWEEQHYELP